MLVQNTSGYPDYVRDAAFGEAFLRNPFQQFTADDLIDQAFETPPWYPHGTAWNYAHTNYVILGEALAAAGEKPLDELLLERVIKPMGLQSTVPVLTPEVPGPVLHSFSSERGYLRIRRTGTRRGRPPPGPWWPRTCAPLQNQPAPSAPGSCFPRHRSKP